MYLGIDLGTSGVKAVLVDDRQDIVDQANAPLAVDRPQPLWSEQNPDDWWHAVDKVMLTLKRNHPMQLAAVRGIGLAGQMHGATLLDASDHVLRPAILWNDGRSRSECAVLEAREPASQKITGNIVMPGFTAPKLVWVARHEPEIFAQVAKVLLPKDYIRLRMTGEHISDMSDASGTLWLDVASRDWSDIMLMASGLSRDQMPHLVDGNKPAGSLRKKIASKWGMGAGVIIAGGGGDNAAAAVGVGAVEPGRAFLSLGTSGVLFVTNAAFSPNPEQAVHAFCHCLPSIWHQMSVILSAADCLSWVTALTGAVGEASLLAEVEAAGDRPGELVFLPYLSGERTPHNDPKAMGVFFGLDHKTDRAALARAVLEGVAFAFADGQDALLATGTTIGDISVVGGGARSPYWGRILASALGRPLFYHTGCESGPAFGAARLARLAVTGDNPLSICTAPATNRIVEPDANLAEPYHTRRSVYRRLYQTLRAEFNRR